MDAVMSKAARLRRLADVAGGEIALATVHLFTNDVDPGENADTASFTEATFTGYASQALGAFGEAFMDAAGVAKALAPMQQWNWTGGTVETVYGFYVLSAGVGTPFIEYCRLDTPKVMGSTSDSLALVVAVTEDGLGVGQATSVLQ